MVYNRRPVRRGMVARAWKAELPAVPEPERGRYTTNVSIPVKGEHVAWSANLRSDIPEYVIRQLHEAAHQERKTLVSMLLHVLSAHKDSDGHQPFYVREEDLVDDRRKAPKRVR